MQRSSPNVSTAQRTTFEAGAVSKPSRLAASSSSVNRVAGCAHRQHLEHPLDGLVERQLVGRDGDLGGQRRLVRVVDAGEPVISPARCLA